MQNPAQSRRTGLFMALICVVLSAGVFTLLKLLSGEYAVFQVMFLRFLAGALALAPWAIKEGRDIIRTARPGAHVLRNLAAVVAIILGFAAISELPVADYAAIQIGAPLLVGVIAPLIVGEKTGWRGWLGLSVAFLGALIITKPGGDVIRWGALLAFGSVLAEALCFSLTRYLGLSERAIVTTTWFVLVNLICSAPLAWWVWRAPSWNDLALFLLLAVVANLAQLTQAEALRRIDAISVGAVGYLLLPLTALCGYVFFADALSFATFAGGAVVALGGWIAARRSFGVRAFGERATKEHI